MNIEKVQTLLEIIEHFQEKNGISNSEMVSFFMNYTIQLFHQAGITKENILEEFSNMVDRLFQEINED